jgi:ankyrin repeat protein
MSTKSSDDEITIKKWRSIFDLPKKEMRKELKNINLSLVTSENQNILHIACKDAKKQSIEILLSINDNLKENKLDINLKDNIKNWTPIYYLLDSSDGSETEILQILIKSGAKINISDKYGITPLHLVSFKGQDEYMSILLQNNVDINAYDKFNRIPLNYAIMEGQLNSAYYLLESGSNINTKDIDGNTLLHYAVSSKGNSLLFSIMLIDRKINLNEINNEGDTALMLIAKKNPKENVRLIKKLIDSGAKYKNIINYKCQSFLSLMGEAAIRDKFDEYRNININKENEEALNKMEKYIKQNINKKYNFKKFVFTIFIPFLILFMSIIINKITI